MIGTFCFVILIIGLVSTIAGVVLIEERVVAQAQEQIAHDMDFAQVIYDHRFNDYLQSIRGLARRTPSKALSDTVMGAQFQADLHQVKERKKLDFLILVDSDGQVLKSADKTAVSTGATVTAFPVFDKLKRTNAEVAGTQVVLISALQLLAPELARKAMIEVLPTPKASPTNLKSVEYGMFQVAAVPFHSGGSQTDAFFIGGKLLNRDEGLVDTIRNTIYRGRTYRGRDIGTVTIFQSTVRVATNIRTEDGSRAIGTQVSAEVSDHVLGTGKSWTERAFVLDGWYLTSYRPIVGLCGDIVGMLYVGIRVDQFLDMRNETVLIFLGLEILGMLLAAFIANIMARTIHEPLQRLDAASRQISEGTYQFTKGSSSIKEIENLEDAFEKMTEAIAIRDRHLKQSMQEQLFRAEKMAALGRLSAGVAHEINNPLGGILTFSCLLRDELPEGDEKREDLDTIIREAIRCRDIVRRLLDYSRRQKLAVGPVNINELVKHSIHLLRHQDGFKDITIELDLSDDEPHLQAESDKLEQVLINLVVNGQEAIEGEGIITVTTRLSKGNDTLEILVKDTGSGLSEEDRTKIFDPFFSTRKMGTGLGLSVVYGIVENHGGTIEIQDTSNQGTTFLVCLPMNRPDTSTDDYPQIADSSPDSIVS
jgi:two-component system NtrC family sensor kinase